MVLSINLNEVMLASVDINRKTVVRNSVKVFPENVALSIVIYIELKLKMPWSDPTYIVLLVHSKFFISVLPEVCL